MAKSNKTKWTIGVIATLTLTAIAATVGIVWDASAKSSAIDTNKTDIAEMKSIVSDSEKAIIGIEKDISFLSQKVEENTITQRQILILQQDILDEVRK